MSNDSFKYTLNNSDDPSTATPPQKPEIAGGQQAVTRGKGGGADAKDTQDTIQPVPWSPAAAVVYTLLVYFFAQIAGSVLVILFPRLLGWDRSTQEHWLDTSIAAQFWFVLSTEVITFSAIWWFIRSRAAGLRSIGLRGLRLKDPLYAIIGFGVYFLAYSIFLAVATNIFPSLNVDQKQDVGFENAATTTGLALTFISLVILPAFVEEVVFRGFLYTGLRGKMKPIWAGLFASLLFAAAHLQFGNGKPLLWIAALDTFALSLVLCYLREKTNSLWPGILLHGLKNSIAFLALFVIAAH